MTDTSQALPQARSEDGIRTAWRLLTIALGIMSATIMARDGLGFQLVPFLDAVISAFDNAFKEIALRTFEPIIQAVFALLRDWFDWRLELHPHWKYAFVLLWLLFGSSARAWYSRQASPFRTLGRWTTAAVLSLLAGAFAGSAPLADPAVFWWSVAWFLLFLCALASMNPTFRYVSQTLPLLSFGVIFFAVGALVALKFIPVTIPFFQTSASPGLATLAAGVAAFAALFILLGARFALERDNGNSFLREWHDAIPTRIGLDTLYVLGGAATLVWLSRVLS